MNRILRRWFPKGTNFDQVTEAEVERAAEWMNNYPRRILGWRSAGAVSRSTWPPENLNNRAGATGAGFRPPVVFCAHGSKEPEENRSTTLERPKISHVKYFS